MTLLAGASGFSFDSWKPGFYPAGTKSADFLAYYSARLPTVELNNTFYRQPKPEQLARWAATVPDGFRFAVKMPRAISMGGYLGSAPAFCTAVRALGDRLGPLLVRFHEERQRDDELVRSLLDAIDDDLWVALDLRHPSWDGAEELWAGTNAVRVNQTESDAPFRYLRLRQPPYDDDALRAEAARLRTWLEAGLTVHVYFKHEDEPTAPAYAARLLELAGASPDT